MWVIAGVVMALFVTAADARIPRSTAIKQAFQRKAPCPSTGQHRGACPGWEIDHIQPLKCNGPDAVDNMQWLTVEEHKAKTRREIRLCRNRPADTNSH